MKKIIRINHKKKINQENKKVVNHLKIKTIRVKKQSIKIIAIVQYTVNKKTNKNKRSLDYKAI